MRKLYGKYKINISEKEGKELVEELKVLQQDINCLHGEVKDKDLYYVNDIINGLAKISEHTSKLVMKLTVIR